MPDVAKTIYDIGDQIIQRINNVTEHFTPPEPPVVWENNDVNFYDWDGRIVVSYSAEDFLKLDKMPENPTREGWASKGWNWSLEDAKAYVTKYGMLEIGQMYNPKNIGPETSMTIQIPEGGRLTVPLMWQQDIAEGVAIDWGDGSARTTVDNTGVVEAEHEYASEGEYEILFIPVADDVVLDFGDGENSKNVFGEKTTRKYSIYFKKVIISNSVTSIGNYAFNACYALTTLTIPDSVTSIGQYAFSACYALTSLTIPDSVTSIGQNAFGSCYALKSLNVPNSVTSIEQYAFNGCYALTTLTIPDSITSISNYAFNACLALTTLTIPDSVTSIGERVFNTCYVLTTLTIPDSVTSIGNYAFNTCLALISLTLLPENPPTLSNANAFNNIPTDCVIYVPYSEDHSILAAYKTATNWSTYADQMTELPAPEEEEDSNA